MENYYVVLRVQAEDQRMADNIAEGISDGVQYPIELVRHGSCNTDTDNDGQVIIYTDYIHPTHGA